MRNLTQLSSESQPALTSPGSPSSDISASLSSLAIFVPSVALSSSVQEDHLVLLAKRSQPHMSTRVEQIRSFSQSYYGHVAHSFLSSPVLNMQNFNYQIINDHNITAIIHSFSALLEKWINPDNNTSNCRTKRASCHVLHHFSGMLVSEPNEPQGGDTPILTADSTPAPWALNSSKTNPTFPNNDLQMKPSSPTL